MAAAASKEVICGDRANIIYSNVCPRVIVCDIRLLAHIANCYGWYCVMNGYRETITQGLILNYIHSVTTNFYFCLSAVSRFVFNGSEFMNFPLNTPIFTDGEEISLRFKTLIPRGSKTCSYNYATMLVYVLVWV